MKLSTRARYGTRMMLSIALNTKEGPILLKDIAAGEDISEKYLSQLVIPLKANGLVNTYRGAHGGYVLSRHPSQIKLREIVETLEGDLFIVDCLGNADVCDRSLECVTKDVWCQMGGLITNFLESITLEDLMERYHRKKKESKPAAEYFI